MSLGERDFETDFRAHIDEFVIHEFEKRMPIRLLDTYTGLILQRSQIIALLRQRDDFDERLQAALREARLSADLDRASEGEDFKNLRTFIVQYLAFAMFSHRWRGREFTIKDLRKATNGVYSIDQPPPDLSPKEASDFMVGIKKLQEFCCAAAKCGLRWAWADTCCIDEEVYGEKSESLNSMFLWYRSSHLTIVFLDDVDDVVKGRLRPVGPIRWFDDREIEDPFRSSYPYPPETTNTTVTLHKCCRSGSLQLQSINPDTQVNTAKLEEFLEAKFPNVSDWIARRIYANIPEWVTRGWTLQETLAPRRLRFYSKEWTLLEESNDRDTSDAENRIFISSFKYRAQLFDHRACELWRRALENTTGIPADDLEKFEPGARDVRTRLRWAARRRTTKDEDMAYCLLGIFDITLPVYYGEGHRAFFRLQEEIIKRTGDVSVFDWSGYSSRANSFIAHSPDCFVEPDVSEPDIDEWTDSPIRMIFRLVRLITSATLTGIAAAVIGIKNWIMNVMKSVPPGHALVNGGMNVSVFEYQVRGCEFVQDSPSTTGRNFIYKLKANGLESAEVTFSSRVPNLMDSPKEYYLCRAWNHSVYNVFSVLLELLEYIAEDAWNSVRDVVQSKIRETLGLADDKESEVEMEEDEYLTAMESGRDHPDAKLREDLDMKRREVFTFFRGGFPVYLIRVQDGRRIRMNTTNRVVSKYTKFDFTMPVVTRLVL